MSTTLTATARHALRRATARRASSDAERAAQLDDLLILWHTWAHGARAVRGYDGRSSVAGDYLTSRQYDDANGSLDARLDEARARLVAVQLDAILHPWRTALCEQARNLCTGLEVWRSPRLPADAAERDRIVAEARQQFAVRCERAGLIA